MLTRIVLISLLFLGIVNAATITTDKNLYNPNESIVTTFSALSGDDEDWIAIYPAGTDNSWGNVIQWDWAGAVNGNHTFEALPVGNYEVRAFFNNSYNLEASKAFSVENGNANQVVLTMSKASYLPNEAPLLTFENFSGNDEDWIAIYPVGSDNSWGNVIQWDWAGAVNGNHTFEALPVGDYEVRAFFNNTYNLEASKSFKVEAAAVAVILTMSKDSYTPNEAPVLTFANMTGANEDWIAIYAAGSESTWGNIIQWERKRAVNGNHTFEALPVGNYEARAFFNNSFNVEATKAFSVESDEVILTSEKEIYDPEELIHISFDRFRGAGSDWIGVFPVGTDAQPENAIQWKYAKGLVAGTLNFDGLAPGTYEVKASFATLYKKTISITVRDIAAVTTVYEDAENGLNQEWIIYEHPNENPVILNHGAAGSSHSIRAQRGRGTYFSFGNPEKKMKFLELDTKVGTASHVGNFGVKIETTNGNRRILFSSYMNHSNGHGGNDLSGNAEPLPPFTNDGYLHNHPGPTDYYLETVGTNNFVHYKINIEDKLRMLEPDNELLSITLFSSAGGDFDNIKLVSH